MGRSIALLDEVVAAAKQRFGPDAKVMTRHEEGRTQWWVKHPGKGVVAAETLRDLADAMNVRHSGENGLLDSQQVAAILKVRRNSVSGMVRRGLVVAERVRGRGGMKPRFRLADVEAFMANHKIRRPEHRPKTGAQSGYRKPSPEASNTTGREGMAQVSIHVTTALRRRAVRLVSRYAEPPFRMTMSTLMESALAREVDRLEKEIG